jgi:uncharacterized protein (DUF302 family)
MLSDFDQPNDDKLSSSGNHHMRSIFALFLVFAVSPAMAGDFVVKPSKFSVADSLDRLTKALESKGIKIVARIDHAAGAQKAGLKLKPSQLLIFGNPKLGTPLMQANPGIGLDLPMKVLAWQDDKGKVWLAYTKPDVLKARYDIKGKGGVFAKMTGALSKMTGKASGGSAAVPVGSH